MYDVSGYEAAFTNSSKSDFANKNTKVRSFKSSEHIRMKVDGPITALTTHADFHRACA